MKTNSLKILLLSGLTLLAGSSGAGAATCCERASGQVISGADSVEIAIPEKTIENSQMIGVGGVGMLDTYLSQEKYTGMELRYISHTLRERDGSQLSRLIIHQGYADFGRNRADNANEIAAGYKFGYGVLYGWRLLGGRLDLRAGALAQATLGFVYNMRNGNNPAQARLALDISPVAMARYRFSIGKLPVQVGYEVSAPLCGVQFSPNYGQSYYEIFSEENYDHNVVATTFVSSPTLTHQLSVDFLIGKTTLRLGYMGDWWQSAVNNLKYHQYSNLFVVGITRRFKLLKM